MCGLCGYFEGLCVFVKVLAIGALYETKIVFTHVKRSETNRDMKNKFLPERWGCVHDFFHVFACTLLSVHFLTDPKIHAKTVLYCLNLFSLHYSKSASTGYFLLY